MPILKHDMGEKVAGIEAGAGNLSRPSYAFQNDPDTGFASRAAGGISVVVDGVEVLSLTADGIAFPLLTAASVPFVGAAGVLTEDNAAFFFTNATNLLSVTGGVVTPAVGPTAAQQHTLPSVASDTVALLAAIQILTNKTLNLTSNTLVATSLQLLTALTDETGTGAAVFANTPTLVSPVLGTPTSGVLTNCTGLPAAAVLAGTFGAGSYTITADLTVQDQLIVSGAGPHAIGGATSAGVGLNLLGFTGPSGVDTFGVQLTAPITVGAPTNAATLRIAGGPTGATTNYGLWVTAGFSRIDGNLFSGVDGSPGGPGWHIQAAGDAQYAWGGSTANRIGFRIVSTSTTSVSIDAVKMSDFSASNLIINPNGGILALGTTATTGQAVLDQASTTAAIPVLVLEQRDVDQPFMFYDTTVGTGNATEAVGAKTLTTTHFVMVNIVGVGNRYFPVGTIA